MTKAENEALDWLRKHNGTGVFDSNGVLLAAGESAPVMLSTWNALRDSRLIAIEGKRVTLITVTKAGVA